MEKFRIDSLRAMFKKFDKDNKGFINQTDFETGIIRFFPKIKNYNLNLEESGGAS